MEPKKFVSYLRCSTDSQGRSGLGLEAQREAVHRFVGEGQLINEFVEVESGRKTNRPQLQEALRWCRIHSATLVVARMDRLSRNAAFLLNLQTSSVKFMAADNPHANELSVGLLAVVAEHEAKMISARTRDALAAAKARGIRLGSPKPMSAKCMRLGWISAADTRRRLSREWYEDVTPVVMPIWKEKTTLQGTADELNKQKVPTRRGGCWTPHSVRMVLQRAIPR